MKIGIFGDSYADGGNFNQNTWVTYLAKLMGASSIGYHAQGASSLFWTYQQLLAQGHNYDRVIVAVTDPNRYPVRYQCQLGGHLHITSHVAGDHYQIRLTSTERNRFNNWFSLLDQDYADTVQELILADIERRFHHALLIPCFKTSFNSDRWAGSKFKNFYLGSIYNHSTNFKNKIDLTADSKFGGISCHFPWEWQTMVAELVHKLSLSGPVENYQSLGINTWTV